VCKQVAWKHRLVPPPHSGFRMLQGDGLPAEADRSKKNRLGAFMNAEGQDNEGGRPKLEANKSAEESLFGSFIQSRQDKVVLVADFQEPKNQKSRSNSPKHRRRSRSPNKSGFKRSPVSVRSKSPDNSTAGNISLPSLQSVNSYRSKSPKPLARSPGPVSPRINSKSPKAPARSPTGRGRRKAGYQLEDSVVRETMAGNRGGKQWNILDDTPGGHAPEKLVIVPGVEFLDGEEDETSPNYYSDEGPALEEDDDIVDDPYLYEDARSEALNDDYRYSESQARSYRTKALPADPIEGVTSLRQPNGDCLQDRFDPSFKNNDMWTTDDDATPEKRRIRRFPSGDVSLLSVPVSLLPDDSHTGRDTISSHAFSSDTGDDISEHDEIDEDNNHDKPSADSKSPATARRSDGRRQEQMDIMSELQQDFAIVIAEDADIEDDCDFESSKAKHPASVPEDESRRKKKSNQDSMQHRNSTGAERISPTKGNGSGRSSKRLSERTGSRRPPGMMVERNATRAAGNRPPPDYIPQSPLQDARSYVGRSPMSSPLTSTPTSRSWVSSAQQQQAMQALRQRASPRQTNKPLRLHVGQDYPSSAGDDDEHTLGASTISTNFTTTQRTRGDNTVSTRSLFQSERMSITEESPQIPQRRRAYSDEESYDGLPPKAANDSSLQIPQRRKADFEEMSYQSGQGSNSDLNANFDLLQEGASEGPIDRKAPLRKPSGENFRRRPFREEDLPDLVEEGALANDKFDDNSANDGVESLSQSKRFLQLHPENSGLAVGANVTPVLDVESPLQIRGKKPVVDDFKVADFNNTLSSEAPNEKGGEDDAKLPTLIDWKEAPKESPNTRRMRIPKLGLFKRAKSRKGIVALSDKED
jgi:hypothetical protein